MTRNITMLAALVFVLGCPKSPQNVKTAQDVEDTMQNDLATSNPLVPKWTGAFGGLPPLDKIKTEHFQPALELAMKTQLEETDAISNNTQAPTFDNTIVALERTGSMLDRAGIVYSIFASTMNSDEFQVVERDMAPKLAAFEDKIYQNAALFARIEAVYNARETSGLNAEQKRLVWDYYTTFVRAGARLNASDKEALSAINQKLAKLFTDFSQNILSDENDHAVFIDSQDRLGGLPASFIEAAALAAKERDKDGQWAILNTRSSMEPFLTYAEDRELREQVWRMYYNRGDNGDAHDNNKIIAEILSLRVKRAKLLGYPSHAHLRLENTMAKTPEKAIELMEAVWGKAKQRVKEEVKDMQRIAKKGGAKFKIAPWDYRFYAEKVRKAKYDLDQSEMKPYLQLDKLREGMFWVAGELFGFSFSKLEGIPTQHADISVYEVKDRSGKHLGVWYFDPYARKGKRSGAWMNAYREQHRFDGEVTTIVSNNSNFVKGKEGEPVLISWTDAETLFHEFGHAIHGLSSNVTYPSLSGTNVVRDYVEFPSQLLEHWLSTDEVLNKFALHHETGKPMPKELVTKIKKAATFNQGFDTVEYLGSALVDMKLHLRTSEDLIDPDAFEKETLTELGMPSEIVMRHRTPQFQHIFAGDSYSAGYYSYLWSDTLTADAFEAFTEGKGAYDPEVAKRLYEHVLSVGNTVAPDDGYRSFRTRDPKTEALMRKRGFE